MLGIEVDPGNIRLIPSSDDPYRWDPLPGKEYLFEKHLSKLSIGPLMELCREVGTSFRAVRPSETTRSWATPVVDPSEELQRLRQERAELVSSVKRRLKRYQREHQRLRRHNEKQKAVIMKYRNMVERFLQDSAFAAR